MGFTIKWIQIKLNQNNNKDTLNKVLAVLANFQLPTPAKFQLVAINPTILISGN